MKKALKIQNIDLKKIAKESDNYRIRFSLEDKRLLDSIRKTGIINPVLVLKGKNDVFALISGFRRRKACEILRKNKIPALIIEDENKSNKDIFILALQSNRGSLFSDLDAAEAIRKARRIFKFSNEEILNKIMDMLSLPRSEKVMESYYRVGELSSQIKSLIYNGKLPFKGAKILGGMDKKAQDLVYKKILLNCHFSTNDLMILFDLLKDMLKKEERNLTQILNSPSISSILKSSISRVLKGKKLLEELRLKRYPNLLKYEKEFREFVKKLNLGRDANFQRPEYFENEYFSLTLKLNSFEALENHLKKLEEKKELFKDWFSKM